MCACACVCLNSVLWNWGERERDRQLKKREGDEKESTKREATGKRVSNGWKKGKGKVREEHELAVVAEMAVGEREGGRSVEINWRRVK